jgi:hypothetical protein
MQNPKLQILNPKTYFVPLPKLILEYEDWSIQYVNNR